ncbi:MAG: hypothetical protein OEV92_06865 [Nitrospinota bacterium]|nr:hypothetical protein [Nitrospinota bacterium]
MPDDISVYLPRAPRIRWALVALAGALFILPYFPPFNWSFWLFYKVGWGMITNALGWLVLTTVAIPAIDSWIQRSDFGPRRLKDYSTYALAAIYLLLCLFFSFSVVCIIYATGTSAIMFALSDLADKQDMHRQAHDIYYSGPDDLESTSKGSRNYFDGHNHIKIYYASKTRYMAAGWFDAFSTLDGVRFEHDKDRDGVPDVIVWDSEYNGARFIDGVELPELAQARGLMRLARLRRWSEISHLIRTKPQMEKAFQIAPVAYAAMEAGEDEAALEMIEAMVAQDGNVFDHIAVYGLAKNRASQGHDGAARIVELLDMLGQDDDPGRNWERNHNY